MGTRNRKRGMGTGNGEQGMGTGMETGNGKREWKMETEWEPRMGNREKGMGNANGE